VTYRPLEGIRVLEWARDRPGPYAARKLADLGADVARVTDIGPRGAQARTEEKLRRRGAIDEVSLADAQLHATTDRNKWSVGLDFSREEDRDTIRRLAEAADVVIEGTRPGALQGRTGLDLEELRRTKPAIVICSISGLGMTGPHARHPMQGPNLDAMANLLAVDKIDGRWSLNKRAGGGIAVEMAAQNAVIAILAAVFHARLTGKGQWIDISCVDCGVDVERRRLNDLLAGQPTLSGSDLGPRGTTYEAADGRPIMLMTVSDRFWENLCRALGREDLLDRWSKLGEHDEALRDELQAIFLQKTAAEWHAWFLENNVSGSYILEHDELLDDPQIQARRLVTPGRDGRPPMLSDPIRWVDTDERPGEDWRFAFSVAAATEMVVERWLEAPAS
jgi:crotonobetainyl-CoA:carnitine CoA-transferase CaiB-like acyl-CoA transferase